MKNILLALGFCFASLSSYAQVDLNKLISETQISNSDTERLDLIMWMPSEFWEGSFRASPGIPEEEINLLVNKLDQYLIFVCVQADMGTFIYDNYKDYDVMTNNIQLSYNELIMKPLDKDKVDSEVTIILDMMKPVLAQMLGNMGENMQLILFDNSGIARVNPIGEADLNINFFEAEYTIPLPINALLPSKLCPTDKESMPGSWKFCPYHGVKLIENKQ